ncbi:hypothetical protein PARPLA_00962 [Rhodobacteraceae bacterium THAF1]|uniref:hypothetical protein n=1 Tax=Palleronia sp. THAF1 TaxID=2587842 RepID=UPI000F4084F7|nr:hypothetical protein [Palleronia sp. THAF1]QFU07498.1 hypothetical protein FIU81_02285 [Palleronia sp. THAF1]VDC20454.1 hypothetical protein PARPLA_00962 [Rhodobacteraceae bacterium THAF1]
MSLGWLLPLLALMTLLIFSVFAYRSKIKTEERKERDDIEKSALAVDGDSHSKAP